MEKKKKKFTQEQFESWPLNKRAVEVSYNGVFLRVVQGINYWIALWELEGMLIEITSDRINQLIVDVRVVYYKDLDLFLDDVMIWLPDRVVPYKPKRKNR